MNKWEHKLPWVKNRKIRLSPIIALTVTSNLIDADHHCGRQLIQKVKTGLFSKGNTVCFTNTCTNWWHYATMVKCISQIMTRSRCLKNTYGHTMTNISTRWSSPRRNWNKLDRKNGNDQTSLSRHYLKFHCMANKPPVHEACTVVFAEQRSFTFWISLKINNAPVWRTKK